MEVQYKYHSDEIDSKIDTFWQAFGQKAGEIDEFFSGQREMDIAEWVHEYLVPVHEKLMWEFGPAVNREGHRLVITPESDYWLRPLADRMIARAPDLPGWEFYSYRLAGDMSDIESSVEGRTGQPLKATGLSFERDSQNTIGVHVHFDQADLDDEEFAFSQAFVVLETLLGEEWLDKWVGFIETAVSLEATIPVAEARDKFVALMEAIQDDLPDQPLYSVIEDNEWLAFELKAEEQTDYHERDDMFVATSGYRLATEADFSSYLFCSERFSRHGEVFCYLKMDGSQGVDTSVFEDKASIHDALDEVLIEKGLGCTYGGGTGLRYSYIDFALVEFDTAIAEIISILRHGKIARRSWILFFDNYRKSEWIPVWEESPTPLLAGE